MFFGELFGSPLTFGEMIRLLEKDLGLEAHALDAHERFVKEWLEIVTISSSFLFPRSKELSIIL